MDETGSWYKHKLRQCRREAVITLGALVATIVVWAVLGFGLAGVPVKVAGVPLWAVLGTVGTWVFAIIVSVVLARMFYADDALEGGEGDE